MNRAVTVDALLAGVDLLGMEFSDRDGLPATNALADGHTVAKHVDRKVRPTGIHVTLKKVGAQVFVLTAYPTA